MPLGDRLRTAAASVFGSVKGMVPLAEEGGGETDEKDVLPRYVVSSEGWLVAVTRLGADSAGAPSTVCCDAVPMMKGGAD